MVVPYHACVYGQSSPPLFHTSGRSVVSVAGVRWQQQLGHAFPAGSSLPPSHSPRKERLGVLVLEYLLLHVDLTL